MGARAIEVIERLAAPPERDAVLAIVEGAFLRVTSDGLGGAGKFHLLAQLLLSEGPHKAIQARNLLRLADLDDAETTQIRSSSGPA